jgi:membrane protease YdiL (CAAX protease family)
VQLSPSFNKQQGITASLHLMGFTGPSHRLHFFKTSGFTAERIRMRSWVDVLTGPPVYRADTPWSPSAAIGAVALIESVQLTLPLIVYGLSPELYQAISGETGQPRMWPPSGSPILALFQHILTGCLVWFAAGLRNGKPRAVLSLYALKGETYTYVALALLTFGVMVPIKYLSGLLSFLHSLMGPILSLGPSSTWPWMGVLVLVIVGPVVEEFMYRGFLLSALAKSRIGFWGAAIFTDAVWTAMHAPSQSWYALPPIFVFGLLASFLLRRTGNLWSCIFAHITVNGEIFLVEAIVGVLVSR